MKKIKFILLAFTLLLLTGCSSTYRLEIYNDKYIEYNEYLLTEDSTKAPLDVADEEMLKYFDNSDILYSKNFKSLTDKYGIYAESESSFKDYKDNMVFIDSCYKAINLTSNSDYIVIRTSKSFLCFDYYENLDDVTFSIKSNHKVYSNNADKVEDNTYTWNITKENAVDKVIDIKLYKDKYIFNYNNKITEKMIYIVSIIGIILVISGTIVIFFRVKNKKANRV